MANSRISIPASGIRAMQKLLDLGEKKREEIHQLLTNIEASTNMESVIDQISSKVEISRDDLANIIETVFSLYFSAWQSCIEIDKFISQVTSSLIKRKDASKSFKFTEEQGEILKKYLSSLVSLDNVGISAKGIMLAMGNSKLFRSSRIFTDIRPCFPATFDRDYIGALVLHQLEITYQDDRGPRSIYITLDADDVDNMKMQLTRAQQKESSIRNGKILTHINFIDREPNRQVK
jgi:hypothetical protein